MVGVIHIGLGLKQVGCGNKLTDFRCVPLVSSCEHGTRWRSWLRHCATNRKVAGSIPDGVTGIFQ
jgi:hypothetical protein